MHRLAGRRWLGWCMGPLPAAGIGVHLAEPAGTAFARGRKRHAKTGWTDARHLRQLLAEGALRTTQGLEAMRAASAAHLSPAGQPQVAQARGPRRAGRRPAAARHQRAGRRGSR
jgi:hypothetical protein